MLSKTFHSSDWIAVASLGFVRFSWQLHVKRIAVLSSFTRWFLSFCSVSSVNQRAKKKKKKRKEWKKLHRCYTVFISKRFDFRAESCYCISFLLLLSSSAFRNYPSAKTSSFLSSFARHRVLFPFQPRILYLCYFRGIYFYSSTFHISPRPARFIHGGEFSRENLNGNSRSKNPCNEILRVASVSVIYYPLMTGRFICLRG